MYNTSYPYHLDRSSKKYECPQCHQRRFVLYVDSATNRPVDETCGRCDREQNCGYHLPPREFFSLHPGARPTNNYYTSTPYRGNMNRSYSSHKEPLFNYNAHPSTLDINYLYMRRSNDSGLVNFLYSVFPKEKVDAAADLYMLGATKQAKCANSTGNIIFWQIDSNFRLRTGKIMDHDTTGHRVKGTATDADWIHSRLLKCNRLTADWKQDFTQCFFGEHLLNPKMYPENQNKPIGIVEAEKTAVVCSIVMPGTVWLSVGGSNMLDKILMNEGEVLKGRSKPIIIYPDAGCYSEWDAVATKYTKAGLKMAVSDLLERSHAEKGSDIADYIIEYAIKQQTEIRKEVCHEMQEAANVPDFSQRTATNGMSAVSPSAPLATPPATDISTGIAPPPQSYTEYPSDHIYTIDDFEEIMAEPETECPF